MLEQEKNGWIEGATSSSTVGGISKVHCINKVHRRISNKVHCRGNNTHDWRAYNTHNREGNSGVLILNSSLSLIACNGCGKKLRKEIET